MLKAIGADGLGVPFQGAGPMSHALLGGTIMAITESPRGGEGEQPADPCGDLGRTPCGPARRADHEGAWLSGDRLQRRRADRAGQDAGCGRDVLEKACATATAAPEYKAIVERLGAEPRYLPGDQFRNMFDEDSIASADAIKRAGLGAR